MERYLYFGENDISTTGEAAMYPLSSFLGATPSGEDAITLRFKARNGSPNDDVITVDFADVQTADATITTKRVMGELAKIMKFNGKNIFLNVNDGEAGTGALRGQIAITSTDVGTVA